MPIRAPTMINIPDYHFLKPADVIVERVGDKARTVDRYGNIISEEFDHALVWREAIDAAPDYGIIVGLGEFIFNKGVGIKKPLTIIGGKFIRDTSVGSNPHAFFNVGNSADEDLLEGPVRFVNCYFDGNERNITQKYTEPEGAPVHVGVIVARIKKVLFIGNVFKDMAREAIWVTTISNTSGVIDHEEIIITNNYFENVAYGITAESYRKIIVNNNIVKGLNAGNDSGGSYSVANYFFSLNYLDVEETLIANNIIDGEVPEGYPYAGTWGFTAVKAGGGLSNPRRVIRGNWITHVKVGIFTVWRGLIESNYIYDVGTGMDLYCAKYSVIRGNQIRRFSGSGIICQCDGGNYAEGNIFDGNVIDCEDLTASYGIQNWTYARWNIWRGNIIRGTYSTARNYIWGDVNVFDHGIYDSASFNNLVTNLANFPDQLGQVIVFLYDGTYYYIVQIDLANKVARKVQVS